MQSTLNKALIALFLICAGAAALGQRRAEENFRKYLNLLAEHGQLIKEKDGIWSRLLIQSDKIVALQQDSAFHDLRVGELLDVIKKKDGRITALVAYRAAWEPDTVTIEGKQDTIYAHASSRERVAFNTEIKGDSVYGYTLSNPPEAFIGLRRRPVSFAVALVEGKNGQYETVMTSDNPYMEITAASGQVIPYQKSGFLGRFFSGPEIAIGWTRKRGVNVTAGIDLWRIKPRAVITEFGLDYGADVTVWRR